MIHLLLTHTKEESFAYYISVASSRKQTTISGNDNSSLSNVSSKYPSLELMKIGDNDPFSPLESNSQCLPKKIFAK